MGNQSSRPRYVEAGSGGFAPIASDWPREGYDRDDMMTNLLYLKADLERLPNSISWSSNEAPPFAILERLEPLWLLVDSSTTDEIAQEVHALIVKSLGFLQPFCRRIIYCRKESQRLECAIALCTFTLLDGMLKLDAFNKRIEDLARCRELLLEAKLALLSAKRAKVYRGPIKIKWTVSAVEEERREVDRLKAAGDQERKERDEVLIPLNARTVYMRELLKKLGLRTGEDGRVKAGDVSASRAAVAAALLRYSKELMDSGELHFDSTPDESASSEIQHDRLEESHQDPAPKEKRRSPVRASSV